jgi:hypothetical protein
MILECTVDLLSNLAKGVPCADCGLGSNKPFKIMGIFIGKVRSDDRRER